MTPHTDAGALLKLLQASSCFRGDVCSSLPCACAESLARQAASQGSAGGEQSEVQTDKLTPEQVYLINDMIHAWFDPEKKGEFRQAFRNDCKQLLATSTRAVAQAVRMPPRTWGFLLTLRDVMRSAKKQNVLMNVWDRDLEAIDAAITLVSPDLPSPVPSAQLGCGDPSCKDPNCEYGK